MCCISFNFNSPVPFGVNFISPLLTDTISFPFTSRLPPNCGEVSSTTLEIPLPLPPTVDLPVIQPLLSTVITGYLNQYHEEDAPVNLLIVTPVLDVSNFLFPPS